MCGCNKPVIVQGAEPPQAPAQPAPAEPASDSTRELVSSK